MHFALKNDNPMRANLIVRVNLPILFFFYTTYSTFFLWEPIQYLIKDNNPLLKGSKIHVQK